MQKAELFLIGLVKALLIPERGVLFLRSRKAAPDCRASIRLSITPVSSPSTGENDTNGENKSLMLIYTTASCLCVGTPSMFTEEETWILEGVRLREALCHETLEYTA